MTAGSANRPLLKINSSNNKKMVGLILLYFVGKAFYDLADANNKGKWLFAILGVVSYYTGIMIGGILIGVGYELFIGSVDDVNATLLGFFALPFGVLACWGFYRILKSQWQKKKTFSESSEDVLDANLIDQK
jgi:amino acid permease